MKIKALNAKDGVFCFSCGRPFKNGCVLALGPSFAYEALTFNICRGCMKRLCDRAKKVFEGKDNESEISCESTKSEQNRRPG